MAYLPVLLLCLAAMASGTGVQTSCEGEECLVDEMAMSLLHVNMKAHQSVADPDAPILVQKAADGDSEKEESENKEHLVLDVAAAEQLILAKLGVKSASELNVSQQAKLQECKAKIEAGTNETQDYVPVVKNAWCPYNQRFDISAETGFHFTVGACALYACSSLFYESSCGGSNGRYFYTNADPDGSTHGACKCCTRYNPTLYLSTSGNNIYKCT